jgi:quercetin dioxygenase-like cupin family protein
MMTLSEIVEEATLSGQPVVQNIYQADGSKLIAIGMKGGMVLPEHKAPAEAKLMVIKGEIDFNTATKSLRLAVPDSLHIPLDVVHSVQAYNDALFLLLLEQQ